MGGVNRVAVIGTGPAGAIAIDALAQEKAFDIIRVFERREGPGGCWIGDTKPSPNLTDLPGIASRNVDKPLPLPARLPAHTSKSTQPRFTESSVYPYLETNVDAIPMSFSQEPFPTLRSGRSIALHGEDTPFRHWEVVREYVTSLVDRRGYQDLISYNTTVERAEKVDGQWKLTLRREGQKSDYWWVEWFDAVVVASGHYNVPYIPSIPGLDDLERQYPGTVQHTKQFRGRENYRGKKVVVVGASVSGADTAVDLVGVVKGNVNAVVTGHRPNLYFGDVAFKHPDITARPSIERLETANGQRTVHFVDGSSVTDVDHIIFGTGYSWTLPFLPDLEVRNNRVPNLYQHVVYNKDPTLLFVGAVAAGLTFKVFEWQAVLAARLLAGRATLPPLAEQQKWEADRVANKGDGVPFTAIFPDFAEYFETVRGLAGEGVEGAGRKLPKFRGEWEEAFFAGHEKRKRMWARLNAEAQKKAQEREKSRL